VSKDALLAQVWNGTAVEENNLTQSISTLRKVLGEKRGENRFITTEPGNGYRFVASVTRIEDAPFSATEAVIAPGLNGKLHDPRAGRRPTLLLVFVVASLACLIAGVWLW